MRLMYSWVCSVGEAMYGVTKITKITSINSRQDYLLPQENYFHIDYAAKMVGPIERE